MLFRVELVDEYEFILFELRRILATTLDDGTSGVVFVVDGDNSRLGGSRTGELSEHDSDETRFSRSFELTFDESSIFACVVVPDVVDAGLIRGCLPWWWNENVLVMSMGFELDASLTRVF